MSNLVYKVDINSYVNKLTDIEFNALLDTPSGDRDYVIFNIDLNNIEASKLAILVNHSCYSLKNRRLIDQNDNKNSSQETKFKVIKRDGQYQDLDKEKIYDRNRKLWSRPPALNNISENALKEFCEIIVKGVYNGISTSELDEQAAIEAANLVTKHPDYGILASRLAISNHEKNLRNYSFMGVIEKLYRNKDRRGDPYPLVSKELYKFVGKNRNWIESAIDYSRDYNFDFFGFKTLERSYLIKIQRTTMERPQDMAMRVAIGIWLDECGTKEINVNSKFAMRMLNTYHGISLGYFIHASPTLFNAGTNHNQFLSCFLFEVGDSLEGIMNPQTNAAKISKYAGGNGCHFSTVRSKSADIKGTNGESGGPIPFILNYDATMRAWDQGGRRKGALAVYMSPEHPQFGEFVELRTTTGDLANKSRTIFIGTWIPDLFWYRWLLNEDWSCFDPNETMTGDPDTESGRRYGSGRYLARMYGDEYEARYHELELAGKAKSKYNVHKMLVSIVAAQVGSGMPYMCYKDEVNRCSNQKNVAVVHSSNLCSEIVEPSDDDEYACCTLASICLPKYVIDTYNEEELKYIDSHDTIRVLDHEHPKNPKFNFMELAKYVRIAVRNLDHIIDVNKYPVYQTKLSNLRHRPLGVGVQGLADVFHKMKIAWGSNESHTINKMIFETIYYAAITESCEIAQDLYKSYVATAKKEGKVKVAVDFQSRPIIHKESVTKYDGILATSNGDELHNNAYQRPKFTVEWIVEPIYQEYVLANAPNPQNLPILPKTAGAYSTFVGSPASMGKFQFDMRNDEVEYLNERNEKFIKNLTQEQLAHINKSFSLEELSSILNREKVTLSGLWEWESLREKVKTFGIRNAQLIALMPTSTTSQIMGNNECIEPYTENMYKRTTLAGEFIVVNPHLIKELCDLGIWCHDMETNIKVNDGSVQQLDVPAHITDDLKRQEIAEKLNDIKYRYRTAYEIPQRVLINLAADRQAFVDQSQSLNLHMRKNMNLHSVIGMHFYAWARGLKTGMYYLRSHPAMKAQRFTISVGDEKTSLASKTEISRHEAIEKNRKAAQLALDAPSEVCLSCSS